MFYSTLSTTRKIIKHVDNEWEAMKIKKMTIDNKYFMVKFCPRANYPIRELTKQNSLDVMKKRSRKKKFWMDVIRNHLPFSFITPKFPTYISLESCLFCVFPEVFRVFFFPFPNTFRYATSLISRYAIHNILIWIYPCFIVFFSSEFIWFRTIQITKMILMVIREQSK